MTLTFGVDLPLISPQFLVSKEKIYHVLKTVFDHISKHLKVHQQYSTTHHIFNSLLGVWKCNQTQSSVFDILHQRLPSSLNNFTTETEWMHGLNLHIMHLSMLSHWGGGRAQVGELTVVIVPQWGLLTVLMAFLATFY